MKRKFNFIAEGINHINWFVYRVTSESYEKGFSQINADKYNIWIRCTPAQREKLIKKAKEEYIKYHNEEIDKYLDLVKYHTTQLTQI